MKFVTDDNNKVHILDLSAISESDWGEIAKGFKQLGYDRSGAFFRKNLNYISSLTMH